MSNPQVIKGFDEAGRRISSKGIDALIREALKQGTSLEIESFGQHNIGCRLYSDKPVSLNVTGPVGQRLGAMGVPGTSIVCHDSASDDVGYLNIGAEIVVRGDATNGVCNAMAAGKVMIGGSIGARGLTMTKWNPAYERPELWVLGSVGDAFAEFNCGGIAVVCGVEAKSPDNVLGYRPCVGMVGGRIFYRGKTNGSYAKESARESVPDDQQWEWLMAQMPGYLEKIGRPELLGMLSVREEWKMLVAVSPAEKREKQAGPMSMAEFREQHWNKVFKDGDALGDLAPGLDRSVIPVIVTGSLRLRAPRWKNPGSQAACRDCHLCETVCPPGAISRSESGEGDATTFVYESSADKCIGCGFCRDACPVGVWVMELLK